MAARDTIVRVYGLLVHEGRLLLCREKIAGRYYIKFPGGGLEYGEGVEDCVIREFMEETGLQVKAKNLFYLNPDHIPSAFHDERQILSLYYEVSLASGKNIPTDLSSREEDMELFWQDLSSLDSADLELILDRRVAEMLRSRYYSSK